MTWEVPDRIEDHFPQGTRACGRDLADAADLGIVRSYQQEDVPAAAAERVQHDLHEVCCACGRPRRPPAENPAEDPGRLASDDVTQDRLDIRSYIDTARKHGKNAMDVLHDLLFYWAHEKTGLGSTASGR